MKGKTFFSEDAEYNSAPPQIVLEKFGIFRTFFAIIMAVLLNISLPVIVDAQCPASYSGKMDGVSAVTNPCGFYTIEVRLISSDNFTAYLGTVTGEFSSNIKILSIANEPGISSSHSNNRYFTINISNKAIYDNQPNKLATITFSYLTGNSGTAVTNSTNVAVAGPTFCSAGGNEAAYNLSSTQYSLEGNILIPSQFSCSSGSTDHGLPNRDITVDMNYDPYYRLCDIADTPADGEYECGELRGSCEYKVCVTKSNDALCGIDEFDVDEIEDLILGNNCFDYVWQLYAGDVTNDGTISSADIIQLQKVLTNQSYSIPLKWKYINFTEYNQQYLVTNNDECTVDVPVADNCAILAMSSNPVVEDWYGFPVGDVTYSCTSCTFSSPPVSRSYIAGNWTQDYQIKNANPAELNLTFRSSSGIKLWSMILKIQDQNNEILDVVLNDGSEPGLMWNYDQENNQLRMMYVRNSNILIKDFNIRIVFKKPLSSLSSIPELVYGDEKLHNLLIAEGEQYGYFGNQSNALSEIFIFPNPASDFVHISGISARNARFELLSITTECMMSGILNEDQLELTGIPNGVYLLKILTPLNSRTLKLIVSKNH